MIRAPEFAPGCFGTVMNYKPTDMICGSCQFAKSCGECVIVRRQELAELLHLPIYRKRFVQEKAPETPAKEVGFTLPKKVTELLERLDNGSFDIIGSLGRGENPFSGKSHLFMRIACHLLLNSSIPISQNMLSTSLATHLKWAKGTADAHARMALIALKHVGAIDDMDGNYSLKRNG